MNINVTAMADWLTRVPRMREVWSLNPGPVNSYIPLQTVRYRFYASSCVALGL